MSNTLAECIEEYEFHEIWKAALCVCAYVCVVIRMCGGTQVPKCQVKQSEQVPLLGTSHVSKCAMKILTDRVRKITVSAMFCNFIKIGALSSLHTECLSNTHQHVT